MKLILITYIYSNMYMSFICYIQFLYCIMSGVIVSSCENEISLLFLLN